MLDIPPKGYSIEVACFGQLMNAAFEVISPTEASLMHCSQIEILGGFDLKDIRAYTEGSPAEHYLHWGFIDRRFPP